MPTPVISVRPGRTYPGKASEEHRARQAEQQEETGQVGEGGDEHRGCHRGVRSGRLQEQVAKLADELYAAMKANPKLDEGGGA